MQQPRRRQSRPTALRGSALTVIALIAATLIWRLRPSAPSAAGSPDADVVLGCAWLAWALAGYLAVAIAAAGFAHVVAAAGLAGDALARLAPASLRRLIDTAITLSLAAAVLGTSTTLPAVAATSGQATSTRGPSPAAPGGALDWPGLADPARPGPSHAANPHPTTRHHRADIGLVSGGRATVPSLPDRRTDVVVQRGDSLWAIAARHLGPTASRAAITAAWHEWYAANRHVVGANPDLIYPGQQLSPPAQPRSTR